MGVPLQRLNARVRAWASRLNPALHRVDWGFVIALALGFIAAGTFVTRPGLPRGTDAELHVFRAAELGYALRGGSLYPRWAPNLFLGYGYPIFNYYAPLTYYLANLFAVIPGIGIVAGVKGVFVLGLILASVGSYALGRDMFGRLAGIIAAASFTFAPYVVLVDPHARGDLAEHFAVCLLPLAFFAFRRLMSGAGGRGAMAGSVAGLAALVTSHNLTGLLAAALMAGYWMWEVVIGSGRARAWAGIAAFSIAAACSAFFWLPALAEWGAVELVVTGPGHFDFRNHFLSLSELVSPSAALDLGAAAPDYRFNLGMAQWVLALPVLFAMRRRDGWRQVGFFAIVAVSLAVLMLPASAPFWDIIPAMAYLQFPWRLLGPTNLALAICAAAATIVVPGGHRWRGPCVAAGLALLLMTSLPVLYPPMWSPDFGGTGPTDIITWEAGTGALGTTSTRDFVPTGASLVPMHPTGSLLASYSGPGPVDKVNRATIPDGASVKVAEHGPQHDLFHVSARGSFVLRLFTFNFPGWRAYVDGTQTDISVAYPEGFITVRVPEGTHEVLVRFEDTPVRIVGWAVSAVGAIGLALALAIMQRAFPLTPRPRTVAPPIRRSSGWCSTDFLWLASVVLGFGLLKAVVVDSNDGWMRYTSPSGEARSAEQVMSTVFGGEIELIGYDLESDRVRSGDVLEVALYWREVEPTTADYQSFVHLAQPLNVIWGQEDHLNPGELPTTRWPPDKYVRDRYVFQVLPGTPPGEYALNVGLYSMEGGYRLLQTGADGLPADSLVIATVQVLRPRRQPTLSSLGMTDLITETYVAEGVTLAGYAQEHRKVDIDQAWTLTLFWRADRDAPSLVRRELVLLDEHGRKALRLSGVPGGYPAAQWMAGDIVRDPVVVPPSQDAPLEPGRYQLAVGLENADRGVEGSDALLVIGTVKVRDK